MYQIVDQFGPSAPHQMGGVVRDNFREPHNERHPETPQKLRLLNGDEAAVFPISNSLV